MNIDQIIKLNMASDFYKKTKDLFEEFQKRELQYLNAEIAAKSHFQYLNEPAQKYLETLNKREKENEEDYFGLMRHMEQLDQHTESITTNLRKLESLRLSMSSKTPMWPYSSNTYDRSFNDYTPSNTLKTDYTPNDTFLNTKQSVSSKQRVVEHAFTQTDLMFCENCQFPLTVSNLRLHESLSPNESLNRVVQSFQSLPMKGVECDVVSDITIPLDDFMHKNEGNLNSNKEINKEKPSVVIHSLPKIPEEPPVQKEILHDKYQTISTDISLPVPLNARSLENKITTADANIPTVIEHKENVVYEKINQQLITDIPVAADYKENFDQGINKHLKTGLPTTTDSKENVPDVILNETVNILSSDAKESYKNLHSNVVSEKFANSEKNKDSDLSTSIVVSDLSVLSVPQNVSQIESEGEITTLKNNLIKSDVLKQDILSDKGSESPISIAGAPSPSPYSDTASAPSDSDSFDEKERLKESAAYQALLGNVSTAKNIQKTITYSESESEDEVEKALANAARKSSSVPTTITVQEEKPDDSHKNDATEPKAKSEPRKSISLGKSQQLSKSTRKVLGLDTSSGSEGEIRIPEKTSKKTVEDSDDEFFYD